MALRPTQEIGELRNWSRTIAGVIEGNAYGHKIIKDGDKVVLFPKYSTDYHDYFLVKTDSTPKGYAWILYKDKEKK